MGQLSQSSPRRNLPQGSSAAHMPEGRSFRAYFSPSRTCADSAVLDTIAMVSIFVIPAGSLFHDKAVPLPRILTGGPKIA